MGGATGNNKASDEDEWIEVEPEWWGGSETKQGRPTKKTERNSMDEKENEEQACEQWQEGLKKLGARVLGGVRLEAERLNGGPRLVPACNSGLTPGNYWIPHRICQPLSSLLFCFFRIVLALLCLTGSFCSCTIDLPSTFLSFGVRLPSPPFPRHFSLPSHLPVPPMPCLLMSWALASRLFSLLSLPLAVCGCFVQMGKA